MWMPIRSATTEEFPVAMLPNGPACTSTGVFSSVCSRFGLIASRRITAIDPAPLELLGGDRVAGRGVADHDPAEPLPQVLPATCSAPAMAMTSEAAVMSNPVCRGTPSMREPSPITMLRSARSLTSSTRRQVMLCGSRPSSLPWYRWLSIIADSRLCAAVTAWMSPVRCRLSTSIGTTWL